MIKTTKTSSRVRVIGTPASTASLPTINTVGGPIFAGTPEAAIYLELEALKGPLQKFTDDLRAMDLTKREAIEQITALLPTVPAAQSGVVETLAELRAALESGTPHTRFIGGLDGHLSRIDFGMGLTAIKAPKPPHADTVDPQSKPRFVNSRS